VNPIALSEPSPQPDASPRGLGRVDPHPQLAKLLSPAPHLGAKAVEMFRALQLEARYSKREILEAYLNTAPMGAISRGWRRPPCCISARCRATCRGGRPRSSSLPRSPTYRRPDRRRTRPRRDVTGAPPSGGGRVLDARELKDAYDALIPTVRLANPDRCPHLTRRLGSAEARGFVQTTIHPTVQEVAERALRRASGVEPLSPGVANGRSWS
jgi:penicillin-binding protein 1C